MSRFFSAKYASLSPYTPGEQPRDMKYVKLNTNESPFPPCEKVLEAVKNAAGTLQLYPDPDCTELTRTLAERYGVDPENVILTNGSDEILNFAFMAFCDENHPIVFPDITYGFYPVFAKLNGIPFETVPLKDGFTIDIEEYAGIGKNIVLANPNAPTGIALSVDEIERITSSNPDNIVIIDEAYVDFGAQSAVALTKKYKNLLVAQTFSKSRSMAGARLGFGIGDAEIINDLITVKYSTNPYNINRLTNDAGIAAIKNDAYYMKNCGIIAENRGYLVSELKKLGFEVTPSLANFIFVRSGRIDGETFYRELKKRGVLIRHFDAEKIKDYNRITIGSREQLDVLLSEIKKLLEEI